MPRFRKAFRLPKAAVLLRFLRCGWRLGTRLARFADLERLSALDRLATDANNVRFRYTGFVERGTGLTDCGDGRRRFDASGETLVIGEAARNAVEHWGILFLNG